MLKQYAVGTYFFFFVLESASKSSPLKRSRNDFTSSRSMLISLSRALAFASAIFFSSSISSSRFLLSVSKALIRSIVFLKLLTSVPSDTVESIAIALKTFVV